MKKYTVGLVKSDPNFQEWTSVDFDLYVAPKDVQTVFDTYKEAEQLAFDLDDIAWERWEQNHPNATEEDRNWVSIHAPCFQVIEETSYE